MKFGCSAVANVHTEFRGSMSSASKYEMECVCMHKHTHAQSMISKTYFIPIPIFKEGW